MFPLTVELFPQKPESPEFPAAASANTNALRCLFPPRRLYNSSDFSAGQWSSGGSDTASADVMKSLTPLLRVCCAVTEVIQGFKGLAAKNTSALV